MLSGYESQITPVITEQMVMPENRVSKSPTSDNSLYSNPPTSRPTPAPISPKTTKAHTRKGKSHAAAPSAVIGHLAKPCCKNTTTKGSLNSQWLRQNSGMRVTNLCMTSISQSACFCPLPCHTHDGHETTYEHLCC